MMRRSNPFDFSELDRMFERMSRQFEDMNRQLGSWEGNVGEMVSHRGMAIDVAEHDDSLVVVADLPGFEKDDIDLTVAGQTLTIVAEREMASESGDEESEYLRRERRSESIRRSIRLPVDVDEEGASASYQNGVLTVSLPKFQADDEDDSHHIDVQ
ncbi:HSP20 family protein [Halogranum gelatinilyticum]|uniref:HSP20 family protein n=1 Tax=Halogranum gelatinilyticum TaxID=660521 RepID=A0A1G9Q1A8_9EURY|nr:archaeal heat shock protein Hsp14 [Halogranum gelatinilyticum]SDM04842.1 HSP20 family protein [Halogranum gelatinilyticum]